MNKKLIAFDLDGTLAESKSLMDGEMTDLLQVLLEHYQVAVISGGAWSQFQTQMLSRLRLVPNMDKMVCLPTSGACMYRYKKCIIGDPWVMEYQEKLTPEELARIYETFYTALFMVKIATNFIKFDAVYGQQLENRITQVTFSALGQDAPLDLKEKWDPDCVKRKIIIDHMNDSLKWCKEYQFEVRYGGTTSIDVTRKGIDKAFGMTKLKEHLGIEYSDILFVGDALQPGGNDYVVKSLGIECQEVKNTEDTKHIIKGLINDATIKPWNLK